MAFDKTSPVMQRQTALNTCRRSRIFESLTTPFLRLPSPIPSFHSIIKNIPTIRCAIFPEMPLCQRALYTQPLSLPACLQTKKFIHVHVSLCLGGRGRENFHTMPLPHVLSQENKRERKRRNRKIFSFLACE